MEEPSYYVRFRGIVTGPLGLHQLKAMSKLGQLARFHEVSVDRVTWVAASTIASLFPPSGAEAGAQPMFGPARRREPERVEPATDSEAPEEFAIEVESSSDEWYYAEGGQPCGPVCFADLQRMFTQGRLVLQTLVWSEGMESWAPYNELPVVNASPSPLPTSRRPSPQVGRSPS